MALKTFYNFVNKTVDDPLTYQDVNRVIANIVSALEGNPRRPDDNQSIWMTWKDAATITVEKGYYLIGEKWYNLAADLDWTWAASGQNRGLDTASEATSTWYYLYATLYSSAFAVIASTTAPTAVFDTGLSGADYDTNLYLGAFYNDSGSSIIRFFQWHGHFQYINQLVQDASTNASTYQSKTLTVPPLAVSANGALQLTCGAAVADRAYLSIDNSTLRHATEALSAVADGGFTYCDFPFITAQTIYIKNYSDNAANYAHFFPIGYRDKYL